MALLVINYRLRPLLTKWHPLLQEYEERREAGVSVVVHERRWEKATELRAELEIERKSLYEYSLQLAKIARIEPLHAER
jgi:hypothetical protein